MLRRCLGCLVGLSVVFSLCLGLVWITRDWWLQGAGNWLVADQPPETSDAIVAVSGEQSRREWAIKLYRRGYAGRLVFNVSDTTYYFGLPVDPVTSIADMLRRHGIAPDSVVLNPGVSSTWEDARATLATADSLGLRSLLVVSSPFNLRRVVMTYRRVFAGRPVQLVFSAVPPQMERLKLDHWWTREVEFQLVLIEYLKIAFYELKYFH